MRTLHGRKLQRSMAAQSLAMIAILAGSAFGWGQGGPWTGRDRAETPLPLIDGAGRAVPGQNPLPPEVSKKIASKKKILVLTPLGELIVEKPVLHSGGINGQSGGPSASIPWRDVRAIKLKKSRVGLGAGIGFAVGAALAIAAASSLEAESGGYIRGVLVYGAGLAIPGALIGVAASSWKTVYAAPAAAGPVPRISLAPVPRGGLAVSVHLSF